MLKTRVLKACAPAAILVGVAIGGHVAAEPGDQLVEGYVSWMRTGALYLENRGELRWGDAPDRWRSSTPNTRCYEVQRGIELACNSLATVGFIHRARLVLAADGWVRRIDVVEMRQ